MRKTTILAFFVICTLLSIANGQSKEERQIIENLDQIIGERFNSTSPGCAILVAKKGKVIYEKAFGAADIELAVPMRPEMVFRIGSMTKQYTAIGILKLVEQGKISLQDSVQKFIPSFPHKGHTITIENLLTHTSGIRDYQLLDAGIRNAIRIDFPVKQIIDSFAVAPLDFTPSTKYSYSNSNYFLLGYIIEQISGKSYRRYLEDELFKPLGLSNTFYDSPTQIIKNRTSGFTKDGLAYRNTNFISMALVYSAGALLSNVSDVFKWHQALLAHKVVKKETLQKAFTSFKLADGKLAGYGYGWFIRDSQGSPSIGHGGSIDGFRSMEYYLPEQDIFVAALFNVEDDTIAKLVEDMSAIAMGKEVARYKDLTLSDAILDRYIGIYKYAGADASIQLTVKIYKENGRLYADLSNGTGSHMPFLPQSETKFILAIKTPTVVDFVVENGKVARQFWTQKERTEFVKVE